MCFVFQESSHRSSVGLNATLPLTPATITVVNSPAATQNQISTIKSLANSDPSPVKSHALSCFIPFKLLFYIFCLSTPQNTNLSRSHIYPNIVIQQPADLHAKDPLYLGDKPTGAIVRNPSPSPSNFSFLLFINTQLMFMATSIENVVVMEYNFDHFIPVNLSKMLCFTLKTFFQYSISEMCHFQTLQLHPWITV